MKKHFVSFSSPGTFVHEATVKEIQSWDVGLAQDMARDIKERHGAIPFAFQFFTKSRGPDDLDSVITKRSVTYYLGGVVETLEEIEARRLPDDRILLSNMRGNGWDRVIVNTNSWKIVQPFSDKDVLLDWMPSGPVLMK